MVIMTCLCTSRLPVAAAPYSTYVSYLRSTIPGVALSCTVSYHQPLNEHILIDLFILTGARVLRSTATTPFAFRSIDARCMNYDFNHTICQTFCHREMKSFKFILPVSTLRCFLSLSSTLPKSNYAKNHIDYCDHTNTKDNDDITVQHPGCKSRTAEKRESIRITERKTLQVRSITSSTSCKKPCLS